MRVALALLMLAGCPEAFPDEEPATPGEAPAHDPGLTLPGPWATCPDSQASSGELGPSLEATTGALYCAVFDEYRTLEEERAARAMVRFAPGAVPLPAVDGVVERTVEACARTESGAELRTAGPGILDVATDLGGSGRYRLLHRQPLESTEGEPWELVAWLQGPTDELTDGTVVLNGLHVGLATDPDRTVILQLCEGACADTADGRLLDSCSFAGVPTQRHRLEFDGGWLELDLRIGQALFVTQPALFVGGRGELDGRAFEQRDYWQLLYNPIHHHFSRDFAVFLDDPDGEACAVVVRDADPWGDPPAASLTITDCDLADVEARTVLDDLWIPSLD